MAFNNVIPGFIVHMWLIEDQLKTVLGWNRGQIEEFWDTPNPELDNKIPRQIMSFEGTLVAEYVDKIAPKDTNQEDIVIVKQ